MMNEIGDLKFKKMFVDKLNILIACPRGPTTEDRSTEALLQILYGPYLILGVFGSCMF